MTNLLRAALFAVVLACAPVDPASAATGPAIAPMICHECDYERPPPREATPPPPAKKGAVDPIAWTNGHSDLVGWTCQQGRTESNDVHLYVGGPAGVGYFVVGTTANLYSEPAVAAQCGVTGSWYRWKIPLFENIRSAHPGKALYVYAVSPIGGPVLLAGSGHVTVPWLVNDAQFVAQELPQVVAPNGTATARVQMRNTGNTVWTSDRSYRLGAQNPRDNATWGTARVAVAGAVAPGETATFDFTIRAPASTGVHNFQWRMVRDGVEWFGATTPNATIPVASGWLHASPNPCTIPWGGDRCAATLQWGSSAANAEVWVTDLAGNSPALLGRAQSASVVVPWIGSGGARFHLKAGGWSSGTLATHDVRGAPTLNSLPQVTLTAPASGQSILVGSSVALFASATDADDGVARVEFLVDGIEVGEDASPPYALTWAPSEVRSHALSARAVDTRGGSTVSAVVALAAHAPPPPPPIVTLTRRYTYNAHQELCRADEPETGASFYGYDAAGNLAWSASGVAAAGPGCSTAADVAPRRIDRTYDSRNRVRTVRFPDGRGDANYRYALDGLLTAIDVNNGDGELLSSTYVYNQRRLLVQETLSRGPGGWPVYYGYDANGHLASQHWYGVTVDYAPNALGQPTRAGEFASNVRHHPNGAIAHFTYGNGIAHTTVQNARQLPGTRIDAYAGVAFLNDAYDYDATGNVAAITDGATGTNQRGNRTMTYDGLDRLVAVSSPMFANARYEYDALDNLTRTTIGGPAARDHWHCHDAHNRLTNIKANGCGGTSVVGLGYDAQGNLANRNGVAYAFDYGNRLRNVVAPHGTSSYTYDGHGRRFLDATPAGDKYSQYAHDGRLVLTSDARTNRISQYVHLGGMLIAIREIDAATRAVANKYQHTDALGTPVAVTDQHRNVIERSEYEPYGKVINRTQKDGPGFTGHVEDKWTGLINAQQRYLDPDLGRFVSVDQVTPHSFPVVAFNRYRYANGNPYAFTDPDGRFAWLIPIIFGGGAFLVSEPANAPAPGETTLPRMGPGEAVVTLLPPSRVVAPLKFGINSDKTYQTYVKPPKDSTTHGPYVGRTSGTGTPVENVARRDRYHHANGTHGPADLDKSSSNPVAIRGREQQQIEVYGGAQSVGGTSGNKINGISAENPKRRDYLDAAGLEFE